MLQWLEVYLIALLYLISGSFFAVCNVNDICSDLINQRISLDKKKKKSWQQETLPVMLNMLFVQESHRKWHTTSSYACMSVSRVCVSSREVKYSLIPNQRMDGHFMEMDNIYTQQANRETTLSPFLCIDIEWVCDDTKRMNLLSKRSIKSQQKSSFSALSAFLAKKHSCQERKIIRHERRCQERMVMQQQRYQLK